MLITNQCLREADAKHKLLRRGRTLPSPHVCTARKGEKSVAVTDARTVKLTKVCKDQALKSPLLGTA